MSQRRIPEESGGGGAVPDSGVTPGGGAKAHVFDFRPWGGSAGYFYASASSFTYQYTSGFFGTGDTVKTYTLGYSGMLGAIQAIGSVESVTQATTVYPYVSVQPGASPSYYFGSGPLGANLTVDGTPGSSLPDLPFGTKTGDTVTLSAGGTLNFSFAPQPSGAVSMYLDSGGNTSKVQAAPIYGKSPQIKFGLETPGGGSVQAGNAGGFLSLFIGQHGLPADTVYNAGKEKFTSA